MKLEGFIERPIDDIVMNGMFFYSYILYTRTVFKPIEIEPNHNLNNDMSSLLVKSITGSKSDFMMDPSSLLFGSDASPTNCTHDQMQCFTFYAVDDEVKEDIEKFKLHLTTSDAGVCFCSDQTHVTIEEDDSDSEGILIAK